jgi:hypothetical protein
MKRPWLTAAGLGVLALALCSCGRRLAAEECDSLLDHYVELLLREDRPGASAGELLKLQQDARRKAQSDPAFHECSERVSRRGYDCAMAAEDPNRLEQCLL